MANIESFNGINRFLSNFWFAKVEFEGEIYNSVEHAYQAAKTLDKNIRAEIRALVKPGETKKFTKLMKIRNDWDDIKLDIMEDLVRKKFKDKDLAIKLLDTGDCKLIEGNTWGDVFWGVCRGKGENNLGKILMKVRAELKNAKN